MSGDTPRRGRRSWVSRRAAGIREPVARSIRLVGLSAVVGIVAGLAAAGLDAALELGSDQLMGRFASPGGAEILDLDWQILLLPALGGLASGLIVRLLARTAHGHGTDQLVHSFHHDGRLDLRGSLVKAGAAVGIISCGGSAGPEGPIAALGAAIGSSVARYLHMTPRERRVLLLAGCAGGVGAIFGCPLGGALFATSILYQEPEFETESLVPAIVASVVSYSTFMAFDRYGTHLLRDANALVFQSPAELPVYVLLGVACGLMAILFSASVSAVERRFDRMHRMPAWLRPALGGTLTGAVAIALPQVMDPQYRFVQNALDGSLFADPSFNNAGWLAWAALFGLIAVGKCVATAFTVGSGGAGGVLGPSVFIGGMTGAFVGAAMEAAVPGIMPDTLRQALIPVGMAGVLSAAMRVPIASMVMVIEMTGSYGLVVPLMLVTTTAYLVGRRWGLIEDQVPSSAQSPVHAGDSIVHLLETCLVQDVMERNWPFLATPNTKLVELVERLPSGTRPYFAILNGYQLVGVVSVSDILHLASEPGVDTTLARDIMTRDLITLEPRRTLYEALHIFGTENVSVLPVITDGRRDGTGRFLGMLSREDVYALVRRHMDRIREQVLHEHEALGAIEQDDKLSQLLAGMPSTDVGTIERMPVPARLTGRSLLQVGFRNLYRAEVLAVQTSEGRFLCPPDPQRPLAHGDHLIVLTSAGQVRRQVTDEEPDRPLHA